MCVGDQCDQVGRGATNKSLQRSRAEVIKKSKTGVEYKTGPNQKTQSRDHIPTGQSKNKQPGQNTESDLEDSGSEKQVWYEDGWRVSS